jgi:hypothetical protein
MARVLRSYTVDWDTVRELNSLKELVRRDVRIAAEEMPTPSQTPTKRVHGAQLSMLRLNEEWLTDEDMSEIAFQCNLGAPWRPSYGNTERMLARLESSNPLETKHCDVIRGYIQFKQARNRKINDSAKRILDAAELAARDRPHPALSNDSRFVESVLLTGIRTLTARISNRRVEENARKQDGGPKQPGARSRRDGGKTQNQPVDARVGQTA